MITGVIKSDNVLSDEEAKKILDKWEEISRDSRNRPILLGKGLSYQPLFQSQFILDPSIVICGYCGQWAAVQTECKHCGAQVI